MNRSGASPSDRWCPPRMRRSSPGRCRGEAGVRARALPDAQAVALQSGWPTPVSEVSYRDRTIANVLVFGITPPYQIVQDYQMLAGVPLTDPDVRERRPVAAIGNEIAEKLFDRPA